VGWRRRQRNKEEHIRKSVAILARKRIVTSSALSWLSLFFDSEIEGQGVGWGEGVERIVAGEDGR
jgi:hypothetical protein